MTITDAEAIGRFRSISEADMFDVEYWPLEQAKLGKEPDKPLAGQIAVVTGAAGAIGAATAKAFAAAGAEVALLDVNFDAAAREAKAIGPNAQPFMCDVTNDTVRAAFGQVVSAFGGVDIVVSTRARRGRAASAKWTTRSCARASSSISSATSGSHRPP